MRNGCIPRIGMRNIKTACAAALCVFLYYFIRRTPTFACIGAIFGMGNDLQSSKLHGGNRLFGTVIGGILGIALFRIYLIFYPDGTDSLLMVPLTFIGIVLLIILCQIFWIGGVLLFSTPVDSYIRYALNGNPRVFTDSLNDAAKRFRFIMHLQSTSFYNYTDLCYLYNGTTIQLYMDLEFTNY